MVIVFWVPLTAAGRNVVNKTAWALSQVLHESIYFPCNSLLEDVNEFFFTNPRHGSHNEVPNMHKLCSQKHLSLVIDKYLQFVTRALRVSWTRFAHLKMTKKNDHNARRLPARHVPIPTFHHIVRSNCFVLQSYGRFQKLVWTKRNLRTWTHYLRKPQ